MPASRSRLLETALAYVRAQDERSLEANLVLRSPTCMQHLVPSSVGGRSLDNDLFATFYENALKDFRSFKLSMAEGEEPIIDVERRKVVLRMKASADHTFGRYENEYVFILQLSEDGQLLEEIVEVVDSAYVLSFFKVKNQEPSAK